MKLIYRSNPKPGNTTGGAGQRTAGQQGRVEWGGAERNDGRGGGGSSAEEITAHVALQGNEGMSS